VLRQARRRIFRKPTPKYYGSAPLHGAPYGNESVIYPRRMNTAGILVCVVDDDESMRESLPDLLGEFGLASQVFSTAHEFLESAFVDKTSCLILDIAMPGMSGPELRRELLRQGHDIPTIFITAHEDFAALPDMRKGIVDCLLKPFSETDLLDALKRALNWK
jgi:FixJ family two-component response regulator